VDEWTARAGFGGPAELDVQLRGLVALQTEIDARLGELLVEMSGQDAWQRLRFAGVGRRPCRGVQATGRVRRHASGLKAPTLHATMQHFRRFPQVHSMTEDKPSFETVSWTDEGVVLLDQRLLPAEEVNLNCGTPQEVMTAIRDMVVRGAPAIGVTAAMGIALGARELAGRAPEDFDGGFARLCDDFAATRPTAVNLFWAIDRMKRVAAARRETGAGPAAVAEALVTEARTIKEEDIAACRALGGHGEPLVPEGASILTHCNAGALATAGYGTALGVVRAAVEAGKNIQVLAGETRPFLQGARLTAWELARDSIPVTVITDSMAGHFMRRGQVDLVLVGADRIAANGDTANKIGTYPLAVLAQENDLPFYVAAPTSTIDPDIAHGDDIPIEERDPEEVLRMGATRTAPEGVSAAHPAFDVTPHRYITAIITEVGVVRPPFIEGLRDALSRGKVL